MHDIDQIKSEFRSEESVVIPDRYEVLARTTSEEIKTIIVPVDDALREVDAVFSVMRVSGRGAFAILRGNSGAGKTTFLHTLHMYRHDVETESIPGGENIPNFFSKVNLDLLAVLRVFVLEEREAAVSFTDQELESWLHAINAFIRSINGSNCLVVWPCNSDNLKDRLIKLALQIGGKSLLGSKSDAIYFSGPSKNLYPEIAVRTLSSLNQGAGLADFGLTDTDVANASASSGTVGDFLGEVRDLVISKQRNVVSLVGKDHPRVWIVVVAGNDPEGDVAGLTRGNLALVDMDRLMSSTDANIVSDLKRIPEKLGVLATVLNARILHFPVLAATAAVRIHADERLSDRLRRADFALSPKKPDEAKRRIIQSEFGAILSMGIQKTLTRGKKLGSKSRESFEKLARVASLDDAAVNRAIGKALVDCGLIESFDTEVPLTGKYAVRSDLLVKGQFGQIRIEMMWRSKAGRADISNYTLKKLENYGKSIGLIS